MKVEQTKLSRAISHALRHEPWLYELELDDEGWTSVEALVGALRQAAPEWAEVSRSTIAEVIAESDKHRHEMVGDRIRALYGHSVPGKLRREAATPPPVMFHGTSSQVAETILREGLRPMGRQYVHLSVDEGTAVAVGERKTASPVILKIDTAAAHAHGVVFYAGNDKVWLADVVPAHFIAKLVTSAASPCVSMCDR
jgi:putative RNA 2'-phosphotransferase